jgi:hypothetical protein
MDVGRFLWMLQHQVIYFSRPSETLDPWEGVPPPAIAGNHNPVDIQWWVGHTQHLVFSCWHENPDESVAMWHLYTSGAEGIAIQSTVGKLKQWLIAAGPVCRMARVRYFNDLPGAGPVSGTAAAQIGEFEFLLYKRAVHAHEQEFRLMTFAQAGAAGVTLPTDLSLIVERIVVSPKYPLWAIGALQSIVAGAGLEVQVEQSKCDLGPPSLCLGQPA